LQCNVSTISIYNMALLPKFKTNEQFLIRAYDVDNQKKITIHALVRFMHEAAMTNAVDLKLSIWDLEPLGVSWVLMRKKVTVHRLPILGETIKVETYPAGFDKFFTHRDYRVFDEEEHLVAEAATIWLIMDIQTRKMARIPDYILAYEMPDPSTCLPRLRLKLPRFGEADLEKHFQVGWYDLDFNKHLNNLHYLQWILETMPDELLQFHQLKEINVLYKLECQWKEKLLCETEKVARFCNWYNSKNCVTTYTIKNSNYLPYRHSRIHT